MLSRVYGSPKDKILTEDYSVLALRAKGKHSIGREFQSVSGKKNVNIDILKTSRNNDRKIMKSFRITRRPPSKIRKWGTYEHEHIPNIY